MVKRYNASSFDGHNERLRVEDYFETSIEFIEDVCNRLHLCSAVSNDAIYYLKRTTLNTNPAIHLKEAIATASIFNSSKRHTVPILSKELSDNSGVPQHLIEQQANKMAGELGLKFNPLSAVNFLPKYTAYLDLNTGEESIARQMIENGKQRSFNQSHNSSNVAILTLFMASHITGRPISKHTIQNIFPISDLLLTKSYDKLIKIIDLLLPSDLLYLKENLPKSI